MPEGPKGAIQEGPKATLPEGPEGTIPRGTTSEGPKGTMLEGPKGTLPEGAIPEGPKGTMPGGNMPEGPKGAILESPMGTMPEGTMPEGPKGTMPEGMVPESPKSATAAGTRPSFKKKGKQITSTYESESCKTAKGKQYETWKRVQLAMKKVASQKKVIEQLESQMALAENQQNDEALANEALELNLDPLAQDIEENIGVDKIPAPATVDRELEPSDMPTDKQLNKKAVAKHQDAWDKTARTWGKVRETIQALIDAKFDHEKLLKVQLTFLDQANAAHKAWAMVVSQQCAADSKFDRVGGYRSSE